MVGILSILGLVAVGRAGRVRGSPVCMCVGVSVRACACVCIYADNVDRLAQGPVSKSEYSAPASGATI